MQSKIASLAIFSFIMLIIYGSSAYSFISNVHVKITPFLLILSLLFNLFVMGLSSLAILYLWHGSFSIAIKKIGFTGVENLKSVFYGISTTILFIAVSSLILYLTGYEEKNPLAEEIASSMNIYLLFIVPLFSSISEEMFFRGLIQNNLEEKFPPAMAIIITSILFSMAHIEYGVMIEIVATFAFSILLGILLHYTKNILAPISSHFLYNFIVLFLATYHPKWIM